MSEVTKFPANTFCWPELATSDTEGAKKFYADVLGWTYQDDEIGPDMVYTMNLIGDKNAGAMFLINEEMKAMNIPPNWLQYVSVDSVDDKTAKAKDLGATALRDPMDVMDIGRMSVLQDPTGGVFALWQPKQAHGSQLINEPGALSWNELFTNDVDRAGKFYTDLFDWSAETKDMGGTMYTVFMNGERPAAGMMAINQEEMGDAPPNWLVYFATDDTDSAADRIKSGGGQILVPPQDIPEVGRCSVAMDPQGAAFAVIKLENPLP